MPKIFLVCGDRPPRTVECFHSVATSKNLDDGEVSPALLASGEASCADAWLESKKKVRMIIVNWLLFMSLIQSGSRRFCAGVTRRHINGKYPFRPFVSFCFYCKLNFSPKKHAPSCFYFIRLNIKSCERVLMMETNKLIMPNGSLR